MSAREVLQALEALQPLAESVLALKRNAETLAEVETAKANLDAVQKKIDAANAEHKRLSGLAAEARTEAVKQTSASEATRAQAQADAEATIRQARQDANKEIDRVKAERQGEIDALDQKITSGKAEVQRLDNVTAAKRQEHDQVLASMQSLKQRLA